MAGEAQPNEAPETAPATVTKTVETTTKAVTATQPPLSTSFDDWSRLIMTVAVLTVFGGFIETLLYQNKLTPEMITFILGSIAGWVSAAYMYSFGSSSGSKAKDQIAQVKNP